MNRAVDFARLYRSTYSVERADCAAISFSDHNMALPLWALMCMDLKCPVSLISFDYHTDTMSATWRARQCYDYELGEGLDRYRESVRKGNDSESALLRLANMIRNDEQIMELNELSYLNTAYIVTHQGGIEDYASNDMMKCGASTVYQTCGLAGIDWGAISPFLGCHYPYILDIDLDFFVCDDLLTGGNWVKLAEGASLIAIAMEPLFYSQVCSSNSLSNNEMYIKLLEVTGRHQPGC